MPYLALHKPDEIKACSDAFRAAFEGGELVRDVKLWRHRRDLHYHTKFNIWNVHTTNRRIETSPKCDWTAQFGVGKPISAKEPDITLEVNYHATDPNQQVRGRFFKDGEGRLFVGHNGRVRKGEKDLVVQDLSPTWARELVEIDWQKRGSGRFEDVILLGSVEDENLMERIAAFVHEVDYLKQHFAANPTSIVPHRKPKSSAQAGFNPEFEGDSQIQLPARSITMRRDHAKVVAALERELQRLGHKTANDQARDLYIPSTGTEAAVLFEVKKGDDTHSVYTAVGQLMLHGAAQSHPPKRVLVIPTKPVGNTGANLAKLGIEVVTFEVGSKNKVAFKGLMKIIS